jgi:hypothetical protein
MSKDLKIALVFFTVLILFSNLMWYRAGKRVANRWYATHTDCYLKITLTDNKGILDGTTCEEVARTKK